MLELSKCQRCQEVRDDKMSEIDETSGVLEYRDRVVSNDRQMLRV